MKSKLAYIDHSFHQKTKSNDFLRDILSKNFEIIDIWDDSWKGEKNLTVDFINSQSFDYVLFFQVLPSASELKKIKAKLIWVPMYDDIVGFPWIFWKELSSMPIKIISFSNALSKKLEKFRLDYFYIQYFLNPDNFPVSNDSRKPIVFFWQRRSYFNFNNFKKILAINDTEKVILKDDPDPENNFINPSEEDIEKYNIEIISGDIGREKYLNILERCNVFVSPRKYEGIGISFLEAMSMGMTVVAYDHPTMNEYIEHGETGYLFSSKISNISQVDLCDLSKVGEKARIFCKEGYVIWNRDKNKIYDFIISKNKELVKNNFIIRCLIIIRKIVVYFIKKVISIVNNDKNNNSKI